MKNKRTLFAVALLCALLMLGGVAGIWAKYVRETTFGGTITITAELGEIAIVEKKAELQTDGTYTLEDTDLPDNTFNSYDVVMPGVDIPKNIRVKITNKSAIPAYVYLIVNGERVGDTNLVEAKKNGEGTGIYYELAAHWKHNGGNRYCYVDGSGNPIAVTSDMEISILADGKQALYVSDQLNLKGALTLIWGAEMEQVTTP